MEINFKNLRIVADYPTYPPYHKGPYLEEFFYKFYIQNKNLFDETGATLIPVFWTNIYNTGKNKHLLQQYLNALPNDKRYFTVSQHDDAVVEQLPNNTIQFSAGGLNGHIPIPLICSSLPESLKQSSSRDILASFVGTITSNVRQKLYDCLQRDADFYFSDKKNWSPVITDQQFEEFVNITSRSWFTLCPRGYGLQSFRVYEALQLNSIPIIIYNNEWVPFRDAVDWSAFSLCFHENEISDIPKIIKLLTFEQRQTMIVRGREAYKKYFTLDGTCKQILEILKNLKNSKTLSECMSFYNSDKSSNHHNYTTVYERLFFNLRPKKLNIFELGLGTNNPNIPSSMGVNGTPGASLRGWKEYFKNSNVYGGDIDKDILFTEPNIETFFVDQTDPQSITSLWNNDKLKHIDFDIIIDDGLHEFQANVCFLTNSFCKLKTGGIFIIEDIFATDVDRFQKKLDFLSKELEFTFEIKHIMNQYNQTDNIIAILYKK